MLRRGKIFLVLAMFGLLWFYAALKEESKASRPKVPPPAYVELRKLEQALPQHDFSLPYPEGRGGRYVKFSNQIGMLGWNNVFHEVLMNAHLAYASQRHRLENPPRTPLSALIAGTVVGESFEVGDDAPRSVSETWFEHVCPIEERRIIFTGVVKPAVAWSEGKDIFNRWAKVLSEAPESCIE
ncbi:hypothetical protein C0992_004778, partial [Termitomyces sp. T32_za158]